MIRIILSLVFFTACISKNENNTVNIVINPKNFGWYFLELKEDSLAKGEVAKKVNFDAGTYLQRVEVNDDNKVNFNVFDKAGNDLSGRMKMSGILSHHSGSTFFIFYNPTDRELEEIKEWLPTDPNYNTIQQEGRNKLEKLLNKK